MKKIILTLGLSAAFTISPLLAENLIDQSSSTFEESRKIYIKPFAGYGIYSSNDYVTKIPVEQPNVNAESKLKTGHMLFAGVDIGMDINEYFGIAGEIGYHYLQRSIDNNYTGKTDDESKSFTVSGTLPSLGVISGMIKPVISIIRSESFSFYVTGGIGASYGIQHTGNINLSLSDKGGLSGDKLKELESYIEDSQKKMNKSYKAENEFLGMSWMLGAGFTIDLNDYTKLDIGYSYKTLGCFSGSETKDNDTNLKDMNLCFHTVHLGVRVYL